MALTTREKKLVVGYLSSRAVAAYLLRDQSEDVQRAAVAGDTKVYNQITAGFTKEELEEIEALDKQIPKD